MILMNARAQRRREEAADRQWIAEQEEAHNERFAHYALAKEAQRQEREERTKEYRSKHRIMLGNLDATLVRAAARSASREEVACAKARMERSNSQARD